VQEGIAGQAPGFAVTVNEGQLVITIPGLAKDQAITLEPRPGDNLMILTGPASEPRYFKYDSVAKDWLERKPKEDSTMKQQQLGATTDDQKYRLVEDQGDKQWRATRQDTKRDQQQQSSPSLLTVLVAHFRELGGGSRGKSRAGVGAGEQEFKPRGNDLK
jgi:hypothetical protein